MRRIFSPKSVLQVRAYSFGRTHEALCQTYPTLAETFLDRTDLSLKHFFCFFDGIANLVGEEKHSVAVLKSTHVMIIRPTQHAKKLC